MWLGVHGRMSPGNARMAPGHPLDDFGLQARRTAGREPRRRSIAGVRQATLFALLGLPCATAAARATPMGRTWNVGDPILGRLVACADKGHASVMDVFRSPRAHEGRDT
jgi:hypothetical protein